jgi:hypothetical protein
MLNSGSAIGEIHTISQEQQIQNLRNYIIEQMNTTVTPVGIGFLGQILGCLHIATQLLDVVSAGKQDVTIKLSEEEILLSEFLQYSNTLLTLAAERLDLPEEMKNGT